MTIETLTPAPDAVERLEQARAKRDALHERIARGEEVSGAALSHAETEVQIAELAISGRERLAAEEAEAQRVERVGELCDALTDGRLPAQAGAVLELANEAQAAMDRLFVAAEAYSDDMRVTISGLLRLAVNGELLHGAGAQVILPDGQRFRAPGNLGVRLLAALAYRLLKERRAAGSSEASAIYQAISGDPHVIEQLERDAARATP